MKNKYCCIIRDRITGMLSAYETFDQLYKTLISDAKLEDDVNDRLECGYTLNFLHTCLSEKNTKVLVVMPKEEKQTIKYDIEIGRKIEKITPDSMDINYHGIIVPSALKKILILRHLNEDIGKKSS